MTEPPRFALGTGSVKLPPNRSQRSATSRVASRTTGGGYQQLLELQTQIGNQAMCRLLDSSRSSTPNPLAIQRASGNAAVAEMLRANPPVATAGSREEAEAQRAERSAGAPLSRGGNVRLFNDPAAASVADALGAKAVTWNRNIFFGTNQYRPQTAEGDNLLRHEVAHASEHNPREVHLKTVSKRLDFIRVKKIPIGIHLNLLGAVLSNVDDSKTIREYGERIRPKEEHRDGGHWWVEMGTLDPAQREPTAWTPVESYGWWPSIDRGGGKPLKIWEVLKIKSVPGRLNFDGGTVDPDQGHEPPLGGSYHPVVDYDDQLSYPALRLLYQNRVRRFASSFGGSWNWRFGWGKNCHTFIDRLEASIGARRNDQAAMTLDPRHQIVATETRALKPHEGANAEQVEKSRAAGKFTRLRGLDGIRLQKELQFLTDRGAIEMQDVMTLVASPSHRKNVLLAIGCPAADLKRALANVWNHDFVLANQQDKNVAIPDWNRLFTDPRTF
ncbi:MAG: DUF4157 domain-containing protein [Acidimicrobiales bacterium]